MYHAKIHPEQYSNTLSTVQIAQLHKSIHYVCSLAVETKADSSQFPDEWLFKHRWGKGKKDSANRLANGAKIVFMTVGGRTSAVVPSVQKKTGKVAGDVKEEDQVDSELEEGVDAEIQGGKKKQPSKAKNPTKEAEAEEPEAREEAEPEKKVTKRSSRARKTDTAAEKNPTSASNIVAHNSNKRKTATKPGPESNDVEDATAEPGKAATKSEEVEIEPEFSPAKKRKPTTEASRQIPDGRKKAQRGKASAKPVAAPKDASDGRRRSARGSGFGA